MAQRLVQQLVGKAQDEKAPRKMPVSTHCRGSMHSASPPRRQTSLLHPLYMGWSREEPGMMASMTRARARKALGHQRALGDTAAAAGQTVGTPGLVGDTEPPLAPTDRQPVSSQRPSVGVDPRPPAGRAEGVTPAEPSRGTSQWAQPAVGDSIHEPINGCSFKP